MDGQTPQIQPIADEKRKKRKSVYIVAIIGLVLILVLWLLMGNAKADCVSAVSLGLSQYSINTTNGTVISLQPIITDMQALCQRLDNITANLNGNATLLLQTNQTLYSFMNNISNPNTSWTVANHTYYLVTPETVNASSLGTRMTNVEGTASGLSNSINTINSNIVSLQSSVNTLTSGKVDTSAINTVNSRLDTLNTSLNATSTDVSDLKESKSKTLYLWIGLILVAGLAIALKFIG